MPVRGTKPKAEHRHRVKPTHDWIEVPDVPYEGAPTLPPNLPDGNTWPARTKEWWKVISAMPHCVLWEESDWQFALDTAAVAAAFHEGDLRQGDSLMRREKQLGTTLDYRRDLRIRYVPLEAEQKQDDDAVLAAKKRLAVVK